MKVINTDDHCSLKRRADGDAVVCFYQYAAADRQLPRLELAKQRLAKLINILCTGLSQFGLRKGLK